MNNQNQNSLLVTHQKTSFTRNEWEEQSLDLVNSVSPSLNKIQGAVQKKGTFNVLDLFLKGSFLNK